MRASTREWLDRAADDLAAAELLLTRQDLTNVVAFHAQQAVEKALKAVIEEVHSDVVRTHSLTRLYGLVKGHYHVIIENMDILDRLEAAYIAARYPGDIGLLPYGKPTPEDAMAFYRFAQQVFQDILSRLEILESPE